jgi:DNA-binding HxlR family transcriptional regulator
VFQGVSRYDELQRHVGLSTAVLADRLGKLCDNKILHKVEYQRPGERRRFSYHLTDLGFRLAYVQLALAEFGYENLVADDDRLVRFLDRTTGEPVTIGLVRGDGTAVDLADLEVKIDGASRQTHPPRREHG